jgi:hypothetical protein
MRYNKKKGGQKHQILFSDRDMQFPSFRLARDAEASYAVSGLAMPDYFTYCYSFLRQAPGRRKKISSVTQDGKIKINGRCGLKRERKRANGKYSTCCEARETIWARREHFQDERNSCKKIASPREEGERDLCDRRRVRCAQKKGRVLMMECEGAEHGCLVRSRFAENILDTLQTGR